MEICARCGHDQQEHANPDLAPQCEGPGCTCLAFREPFGAKPAAAITPAPALAVVQPTAPARLANERETAASLPITMQQFLDSGRSSKQARTRKLAERLATLIDELRNRVLDEQRETEAQKVARQADEAKQARITALKAELAQLTGKPVRTPPAQGTKTGGGGVKLLELPEVCCDKTFTSVQAIAMHRRRAHEGWGNVGRPAASQ